MLVDAHRHIEESEREREGSEPPPTHISAQDADPSPNGPTHRCAPARCGCGEQLLTAASITRGYCEECAIKQPR